MLAAIAAASAATGSKADVVISDAAPSGSVLFSSEPLSSADAKSSIQYGRNLNQDRFGGPLFLASSAGKAASVTFYVSQTEKNTPEAPVTLSLVRFKDGPPVTGADSYTEDSYVTVWSEHFILPATIEPDRYITFNFSNPVELKKDEAYGLILHFDKIQTKQFLNLAHAKPRKPGIKSFRTMDNYVGKVRDNSTYEVLDGNLFFVIGGDAK